MIRKQYSSCHMRKLQAAWYHLGADTLYSMEWSLGAELWSGVLEWSGVKFWSGKNSFYTSPADSVYLIYSNIWSGLF